jgi:hypothetical protein
MVEAELTEEAKRLQKPDDHCDDHHHSDDLFDGSVHWDQPDQVKQKTNHNQSDDDANERGSEHKNFFLFLQSWIV